MIEFYFDLSRPGEVSKSGMCCLSNKLSHVIHGLKIGLVSGGTGVKRPDLSGLHAFEWRTNHEGGARLLTLILKLWMP